MEKYIFFIGGSGARVYKAFIHSAAAGILETSKVSVLLIDADTRNEANTSSIELYRQYIKLREMFQNNNENVFQCNIHMEEEKILSPVTADAPNLNVAVGNTDPTRERMLKALYTKEEIYQELEGGFYSHPNIGCVFFADFKEPEFMQCLDKINRQLSDDTEVAITLVGSVFGGTGAAGIPTILKLIRSELKDNVNYQKLSIGGVFLEPYFKTLGSKGEESENITIAMEEFYFNTYEALSYYRTNPDMDFTSIYLVGQQTQDIVNIRYADSGQGQDNKAHVVELYAALAIDSFLSHPKEEGIYGFVRKDKLDWSSFPGRRNEDDVSVMFEKLAAFTRAQAIWIAEIYNYLYLKKPERSVCKKAGIMVPQWYKRYRVEDGDVKRQIEKIRNYSIPFMEWIYMISCNFDTDGILRQDEKIQLFGTPIQNIYQLSVDLEKKNQTSEKGSTKENLKTFRDKFNEFIDTVSNVEFVLDKVVDVVSLMGMVPGASAGVEAVGLFMKILSLVGKYKGGDSKEKA